MPNLSASEYTKYVKYQAAQLAYANGKTPAKIQTTDQIAPTVGVMNSMLKASQAAFVTKASATNLTGLNYVRAPPQNIVNHPNALSTVNWGGTTSSSKNQVPGGLPASGKVSTYTRLPQQAGW